MLNRAKLINFTRLEAVTKDAVGQLRDSRKRPSQIETNENTNNIQDPFVKSLVYRFTNNT